MPSYQLLCFGSNEPQSESSLRTYNSCGFSSRLKWFERRSTAWPCYARAFRTSSEFFELIRVSPCLSRLKNLKDRNCGRKDSPDFHLFFPPKSLSRSPQSCRSHPKPLM